MDFTLRHLHTCVPPFHSLLRKDLCFAPFFLTVVMSHWTALIRMFHLCRDQTEEQVLTNDGMLESTCVGGQLGALLLLEGEQPCSQGPLPTDFWTWFCLKAQV